MKSVLSLQLSRIIVYFGLFLAGIQISLSASAQAIMVNEDPLIQALLKEGATRVEIANGPFFYQGGDSLNNSDLYPFLPLILAILTQKAVAAGSFNLDDKLAVLIPDIIETPPFTVPLTPLHLVTQSTGFAVPPVLSMPYQGPLQFTLLRQRTPGRMIQHDPVGLTLLARLLEIRSGLSLQALIQTHILTPLDLDPQSLTILETTLVSGQVSASARQALLRLFYGYPLTGLDPKAMDMILNRPVITPFAGGPFASLGLHHHDIGDDDVIITGSGAWGAGSGGCIVAFHQSQLVLFLTGSPCNNPIKSFALVDLAEKTILNTKPSNRLNQGKGYRWPDRFTGYYIEDSSPSARLRDRVFSMFRGALKLESLKDGSLSIRSGSEIRLFYPVTENYFKDQTGSNLYFSPIRRGGYFWLDGQVYRDQSWLAEPSLVLWPLPFFMIALAIARLYRGSDSKSWNHIGLIAPLGAILTVLGLMGELWAWSGVIYVWHMPALVLVWRIPLNIGIILCFASSLQMLIIAKKGDLPTGWRAVLAPFHMMALAVSGAGVLILMAAWGVLGIVWPV